MRKIERYERVAKSLSEKIEKITGKEADCNSYKEFIALCSKKNMNKEEILKKLEYINWMIGFCLEIERREERR